MVILARLESILSERYETGVCRSDCAPDFKALWPESRLDEALSRGQMVEDDENADDDGTDPGDGVRAVFGFFRVLEDAGARTQGNQSF